VTFLKMLVIAGIFLVIIHAVSWFPFGISLYGIRESVVPFIRIAVPVSAIMYLSRRITSEEFYAFLIDIRTPPVYYPDPFSGALAGPPIPSQDR
jgi:hypothetical protein